MTTVAVFASTGAALAASCPTPSVTTPFSQFGDNNSYFPVPGGSFEGTPAQIGWTLNNASLTAGNEPFNVNSPTDSQSLTVNSGGSATSPFFCVDATMPDFRFFAQQDSTGGNLQVQALVKTWYGVLPITVATLQDGTMQSWAPTQQFSVATAQLPVGFSVQAAVRIVVTGTGSSWQVDDGYVDPFRAG